MGCIYQFAQLSQRCQQPKLLFMGKRRRSEELLPTIAKHIRARRKVLGLTQEELAERAGLSANYVARLEIAMNAPSLPALSRLAEALQVDLSALVKLGRTPSREEHAEALSGIMKPLDEREKGLLVRQIRHIVDLIVALRDNARGQ